MATSSPSPLSAGMAAASPMPTPTLSEYSGPGTIAFTRDDDLYTVWSDGTGLRRIAQGARCAAWSPDGSQIACGTQHGLFVMRADGSDQRKVATGWFAGGVAWSPDARQIVFSSGGGWVPATLEIVNADGSGRKDVTSFSPGQPVVDRDPAWSPEGRIFFSRLDKNWIGEISSVNPDGSGLEVVTAAERLAGFSLSPDGKWLLVWEGRSGRCVRIAANGHGTDVLVLEELQGRKGPLYDVASSWSPDGRRIAFAAGTWARGGPSTGLYIVRADGSHLRKVPNAGGGLNPVWQPR